jgi:hypothetical protein
LMFQLSSHELKQQKGAWSAHQRLPCRNATVYLGRKLES